MGTHAVIEVATAFLRLGCTAFGGPFAHLGYFRAEFVERRRWLTDAAWTDTVAMCQVLPGPSSTQTAFALGLRRAGIAGGIAAWAAFTLPSAAVMAAAGAGVVTVGATAGSSGWIAGLRALAVAVVARAAWAMASSRMSSRWTRLPSCLTRRARKGGVSATRSASTDQYSWGLNRSISISRSTTMRRATDWTRPAERAPGSLRHSTGDRVKPTR